jgi:hypothetical protein
MIQSRVVLHLYNNIHFFSCRCCFLSGLKTSSSSSGGTKKEPASANRRKRTKKQSSTTQDKNSSYTTEEVGPKKNEVCHLSEEMTGYVKWMQQGLPNSDTSACLSEEGYWKQQQDEAVSNPIVGQEVYWKQWQELFQLPGARYQSLEDERLVTLSKSAPSMTRVLLLVENRLRASDS